MVSKLRWIYAGWLGIVVAAIVLQFYLAGYGVFGFNGLNSFDAHFLVGDLIGLASLVGIGLAFAARVPWRLTGINALFFALMVIQFSLAHTPWQALSALHVVNGVLVFGVTVFLFRESVLLARRAPAPAQHGVPASLAANP